METIPYEGIAMTREWLRDVHCPAPGIASSVASPFEKRGPLARLAFQGGMTSCSIFRHRSASIAPLASHRLQRPVVAVAQTPPLGLRLVTFAPVRALSEASFGLGRYSHPVDHQAAAPSLLFRGDSRVFGGT